ncbi:MAG: uroporphyrinogen-III C-methyltransferase, partial [Lacipirellulaceae bacterium]
MLPDRIATPAADAPPRGCVALVGAGPGDPGLLTVRGAEWLGRADVVLHDYLASDELLAHAPSSAELVSLGRHGLGKTWSQAEICARMVADALAGKTVVRLKGGDPSVFGRLAEEVAACVAAGVRHEVVPGVTTAIAAGAYAGVTITDRDRASCVAFVTGHERPEKDQSEGLDFARLASFPGTLVVYMAVTNAQRWSDELIAGGKPPTTPVVIVRQCSLPDQQTVPCTLIDVPTVLGEGGLRPPLVAIVGDVALAEESHRWFTTRPLLGRTVLVTRPREQALGMVRAFAALGARVLLQPAIEIGPPTDLAAVDRAIAGLSRTDLVVFSSRNGVEWFLRRLVERGGDARAFAGARLAAIGPATAEALAAWRLNADVLPDEYRAEALADALADQVHGKRVLLVRASRGREVLAEQIAAAGGVIDQVVVYESRDVTRLDPEVAAELAAGCIDWVTAT